MKKVILISSLVFLFTAISAFGQKGVEGNVKTIESVDLNKYAGKWFEIARYPNKFQKQCVGEVTATYNINSNKTIQVVNECLKEDGKVDIAKGKAKIVDEKTNAKLEVRFAPSWLSWLPQVWGDYWILDLGENYDYAVVGDPNRDYLWILSREPELDTATYENILNKVEMMGFKPDKLVKTPQKTEVKLGEMMTKS